MAAPNADLQPWVCEWFAFRNYDNQGLNLDNSRGFSTATLVARARAAGEMQLAPRAAGQSRLIGFSIGADRRLA